MVHKLSPTLTVLDESRDERILPIADQGIIYVLLTPRSGTHINYIVSLELQAPGKSGGALSRSSLVEIRHCVVAEYHPRHLGIPLRTGAHPLSCLSGKPEWDTRCSVPRQHRTDIIPSVYSGIHLHQSFVHEKYNATPLRPFFIHHACLCSYQSVPSTIGSTLSDSSRAE